MNLSTLRQDIPAGLVVFLVALPLCLGIAQASGLPPFVGLLTGLIGGLVVTLFSPSRFAVSGPAAGLVTIVSGAIETLGSFSALLLAIMLAGVLQFLMGSIRAGRFISVIPGSVIRGMLAAIGLLLIIQQFPLALGADAKAKLSSLWQNPAAALSIGAIVVAGGGLLLQWLWGTSAVKKHRYLTWLPGPLVAVLFGGIFTLYGAQAMPEILGSMPRIVLPEFASFTEMTDELLRPDWLAWRNPAVYMVAVTLALVASLETLLSQEALKKIKPQTPPPSPDKELRAQGIGNLLSGFLGGLPITAVIVRSSVNVNAGARSKISILLHGVLLLLSVLYLTDLLNAIPLASLAAVLLYTGYKLAPPSLFVEQWKQGWQQFVPFITTIVGIIALGMLAGIALGMVTQLLINFYGSHRNALQLTRYSDHFVLRFQQNLTFVHNPRLQGLLNRIPANSVVIVEHDNADYIDPDVQAVLQDFRDNAPARGIRLAQWPV
ncbi:SulP family inorganic anion transporter [Dickeya fangzhongdai]|uniref:SulP family inorganic anion transporter n=1 Tax=Dickeya fangzhongdai TaxID=1778540 RepID=UPI0004F7D431|nr:SulP family inorganic anion transporter [Dickeya fangzhongdai]AIR69514.1 SulP family transporter [Dickeya fangzhongdai]KGT99387.1 SulP family transporter [Dickeya fangzhongdai]WPD77728.1 SulP family inorganic anion transporter [Dickeya fangzhongdai]